MPSPYRAVNTLRLGYRTNQLMLYRGIIAVCSEIHTKHINTLCGQNVELLNVKLAVYTYSDHRALNGQSYALSSLSLSELTETFYLWYS